MSILSQPCVADESLLRWNTEQGRCEMQLLAPSQVLQTQPYDWTMLTTQTGVCTTFSKESNPLFLLKIRIITSPWTVREKRTDHKEREQCEYVVKHYFGALLRRKQPSCQSGLLHEYNLGGQGSGKILMDTRALMYPRPLKQMTQILTESRRLADSALQM